MNQLFNVLIEKHVAILKVKGEIEQLRNAVQERERRGQWVAMLACGLMLGAMIGYVIVHGVVQGW